MTECPSVLMSPVLCFPRSMNVPAAMGTQYAGLAVQPTQQQQQFTAAQTQGVVGYPMPQGQY